jgi:hypothetical protein
MSFRYPGGHNLNMDLRRRSAIVYDVAAISTPDLGTIGALARLQLGALRHGIELRLQGASPELLELIGFVGLSGALPRELEGQAEDRKQGLRIEEEAELDDPPVA